ncbi:UNVERIFIED_CONTAM: hypothetical protein Sradi_5839900 [Sesamum radiatum]|uniref:Uncharacterized protein n=1 Tax=Sesamum radiatum TaxID=300843 RepID=A0AAW2KS14_SESRA
MKEGGRRILNCNWICQILSIMLDPKNGTSESPLLYQRVEISRISLPIFGPSNTRFLPPKSLLLGQNPNQLGRTPISLHKRAVAGVLIICLISLLEPSLCRCHFIKHIPKDCLIPFLKTTLQTSQFLLKSHHTATYHWVLPILTDHSKKLGMNGPHYVGNKKMKPSVPQCTLPQQINHDGPTGKAQGELPASWEDSHPTARNKDPV